MKKEVISNDDKSCLRLAMSEHATDMLPEQALFLKADTTSIQQMVTMGIPRQSPGGELLAFAYH